MRKTWVDMGVGTCRSPSDTHYFVNPPMTQAKVKWHNRGFCSIFPCTPRKLSHLSVALFRCPGKKEQERELKPIWIKSALKSTRVC